MPATTPLDPIDEPTTPTEPTGGGTGGGSTGAGTDTSAYTPSTNSGLVIWAYESIGAAAGKRTSLPSVLLNGMNWTVDSGVGYNQFSLSVAFDPSTGAFPSIPAATRFDAWKNGVRLFRGYAADIVTTETEPATLQITGYGRIFDLDKLILQGNYQYAHAVDVSQIFADIAYDIMARFQDIVFTADFIGVQANNIDAYRKDARSVLASVYQLVSAVAIMGFDVDPLTGHDRLYLRKKKTAVGHTFNVPGAMTGSRQRAFRFSDLVNVVSVEGDAPDFPQLLPNGSFEFSNRLGSGGNNQIENPSFEDGSGEAADYWYYGSGASNKRNYNVEAHTGVAASLMDHAGENLSQTQETPVYALVAAHNYVVSFWCRPEGSAETNNPPQIECRLFWRKSDGAYYSPVITTAAPTVQAWLQYQIVTRCPSDATGFKLEFAHVGGSEGGGKGALVDDVALYDNAVLSPTYWDIRQYGSAQVKTINWRTPQAFHGRNCLYLDATAQDVNDQDLAIRCTPSYRFAVVGGQQLRYSFWLKGTATPKLMRQMQFFDKNGGIIGTAHKTYVDAGAYAGWTYIEEVVDVPNAAVQAEAWLNVRGTGAFYLDCLSVRVADDGETLFLDAGNLFLTFRADDLVTQYEDYEVNQSIARYSVREKVVKFSGIKSIADARAAAKTYLLNYASDVPSPSLDALDYPNYIWVGDAIRLTGNDAARYADRVLPLDKITGSIADDGVVTQKLEIKQAEPDDNQIAAAIVRKTTRNLQSQGAQAGALPTGGGVSGSVDDGG